MFNCLLMPPAKRRVFTILQLATLVLLFCGVAVARESSGQDVLNKYVTLEVENTELGKVLSLIERQTEVRFLYSPSVVKVDRKVSVKANHKKLESVLKDLLEPLSITFTVSNNRILLKNNRRETGLAPAQTEEQLVRPVEQPVTGKVIGEDGEGLPGVSVVLKGTQRGTTTNAQGEFTLNVPDRSAVLVFSFVGYLSQEVEVGNKTSLSVRLAPEDKSLNEVVVVGYSSKKQTELSSSVSVIDAKQLRGVTTPSLGNLLQGRASGVMVAASTGQPGSSPAVRIRGTGTISAGADPLYVVDGVIGGTANPSDIESVTVLKDAAATGLYGSRAANGVIVITTKSGKAGKTRINVNASAGVSEVLRGNFRVMNTQQYYDDTRPLYVNDYNGKRAAFISDLSKTTPNPTDAQIAAYLNSKKLPVTLDDYLATTFPPSLLQYDTDWSDLVYRKGKTQNYEISASGGDEKTKFYVAGNYYNEQGTITVSAYERYNVRMNLDHRINKRFRIIGRLNGRMDNTTYDYSGERGGAWTAAWNLPTDRPYNDDGSIRIGTEPDWFGRDRFNFLYPLALNYSTGRSSNVQGDFVLNYDINDWLSFSSTNRAGIDNGRDEIYDDPRTLTGGIRKGQLRNNIDYRQSLLNSNLLKAAHNFGSHSLSGLVGAEFQTNYRDFTNSTGGGVPTGLGVMDVSATPVGIGGSKFRSAFNSYFTQADYNYDNRYFATASFRRDGSSKFGANNQYGNFWAIGGSWIVTNESFLAKSGALSLLKFRGSYGTTGNANIADFITRALYSFSTQYNNVSGAIPARLANPDLTWEKAYTTNLGFNIGFFNRINLSVDAYQRDTKDLLFDVPLSSAAGFKTQIQNVGQIRNRGIDIELNTTNVTSTHFEWRTNFNIGFNRNRVVSLYNGQAIDLGTRRISVDQPLNLWYMQKWLGVDPATGSPLWEKLTYDEAGNVTARESTTNYNQATRQLLGKSTPDFTGGFTNSFVYRGLSLDIFFTFAKGVSINNVQIQNMGADGAYPTVNSPMLRPGESRWQKPGDIATHPQALLGGNLNSNKQSSRYLENGDYLRLRNVRLSYELPVNWLQRAKIANISLFVTGDNLLTWTKFSGMDPEVGLDNATVGNNKYFTSRKFLFGLNFGL